MTAPRRGRHVGKSPTDQQNYLENIAGSGLKPTFDAGPPKDATTYTANEAEERGRRVATGKKGRPKRGDRAAVWLKRLLGGIAGTVGLALLTYLAWLGHEVYKLNRELGEIRQDAKSLSEQVRDAKSAAADREKRTDRDLERIQQEVDRIRNEKR